MFAIAHAAHGVLGLLEAAPVAVVIAAVGWKVWSDRRATAATGGGHPQSPHA